MRCTSGPRACLPAHLLEWSGRLPCPSHAAVCPSPARLAVGLLQAKVIASLGAQPEVLTMGHNPFTNEYIDRHVVLPTTRPKVRLM